jgi:hypothetical protein
MTYDWTPTAARAATTDPHPVVRPRRPAIPAAARHQPMLGSSPSAPPEDIQVAAVIEEFIEAIETGRARNRSGRKYRPSALRDLRGILRYQVARDLGDLRVGDVRQWHVQTLVDRLAADGRSVSRIRSVVSAVRALFGYAIEQGYIEATPADRLVIPTEGQPAPSAYDAPPADTRPGPVINGAPWSWTDEAAEAREQRRAMREARRGKGKRDDHQPLALVPERILSLVFRGVFFIFLLIAVASIAESF